MIRATPSFTRAMRGYDVEEVDEYVEALRDSEDEHAELLAATDAANGVLNAEIDRLRSRVGELEACIRSETPRSIAALGERLTMVLEQAEAGASDAVRLATEEADALLGAAASSSEEQRLLSAARTADAEQRATARTAAAEELARTTEMVARQRAEEIVAEAEQRALARRVEIEAWVERVRAHIEGEEARAAEEFSRVRALRHAELTSVDRRRDALFASLSEMAEGLLATVAGARSTTDAVTPELQAPAPPSAPGLVAPVPLAGEDRSTAADSPTGGDSPAGGESPAGGDSPTGGDSPATAAPVGAEGGTDDASEPAVTDLTVVLPPPVERLTAEQPVVVAATGEHPVPTPGWHREPTAVQSHAMSAISPMSSVSAPVAEVPAPPLFDGEAVHGSLAGPAAAFYNGARRR